VTLTLTLADRIDAFGPEVDALMAGAPEDAGFYRACEQSGPSGFDWFYVGVRDGHRLVALAPAFETAYRLDTTLPASIGRALDRWAPWLPRLLSLNLMALGSPISETCRIAFADGLSLAERKEIGAKLLDGLAVLAREWRCGLVGIKDLAGADEALIGPGLKQRGYTRLTGLPTALLDLPHGDFEAYLASLSRATRKDMKRKLKAFESIRVEARTSIADVARRVHALYEATLARGELQFEHLPLGYFEAVLREMAPRATMMLYWQGERLIAFNLVIETEGRLVDKYIGFEVDDIAAFSPYFNTWLCNVRTCIERGIPIYHAGQSLYEPKLRLGCRLEDNALYFRHSNPLLNIILRLVSPMLAPDEAAAARAVAIGKEAHV
jgi:hypothetical protein